MRKFQENLKTDCSYSLVLSLPGKNENFAIGLELNEISY